MNSPRSARFEIGAHVFFENEVSVVVGIHGGSVTLAHEGGTVSAWALNTVIGSNGFRVLTDGDGVAQPKSDCNMLANACILEGLTEAQRAQVERRLNVVLLVRDGRLPGDPINNEVVALDVTRRELHAAKRFDVGPRSVSRWRKQFDQYGVAGLVDKRVAAAANPFGHIAPIWRTAITRVLDRHVNRSRVQIGIVVEECRAEAIKIAANAPSDSKEWELARSDRSIRRYLKELEKGRGMHLKTSSRRSYANRPPRRHGWNRIQPTRPGEIVAIDANRLDVFAMDPISARWAQVQLLAAIDLYTRSIVATRFTVGEPNAQDAALLLVEMMRPKIAQESWGPVGRWRYHGVPETLVAGTLESDPLLSEDEAAGVLIAGVPVLVPDQLVLDHGKIFISRTFMDACETLGCNLEFARPYTPTDKSHIERVFGTINTDFLQRLPGYKGASVHDRGDASSVEDQAFYFVDEIAERFNAWNAVVYQNAPHDGLRHPAVPKLALTPNEMFDHSISRGGYIPVPIDRDLIIELLPTEWRIVDEDGLNVANLKYDFAGKSLLDPYRHRTSPFSEHGGKWRVKIDRNDMSRVFFFDFADPDAPELGVGQWVEVPVHGLPMGVPFHEKHLAYVKRKLRETGGDHRDRAAVVRELRKVLDTIHNAPDLMTRQEKVLAARAEGAARLNWQQREQLATVPDTSYATEFYDEDDDTDLADTDSVALYGESGAQPLDAVNGVRRSPGLAGDDEEDFDVAPDGGSTTVEHVDEFDPFALAE